MILVHDIFIAKPGSASKLANMFKEALAGSADSIEVLTDMTGNFNKVVVASRYDSLAAYEKSFEQYEHPTDEVRKMMEKMKGYHELYQTGAREIFKVW